MSAEVDTAFYANEIGQPGRAAMTAQLKPKTARDYVSQNVYEGTRTLNQGQLAAHLEKARLAIENAQKVAKGEAKG